MSSDDLPAVKGHKCFASRMTTRCARKNVFFKKYNETFKIPSAIRELKKSGSTAGCAHQRCRMSIFKALTSTPPVAPLYQSHTIPCVENKDNHRRANDKATLDHQRPGLAEHLKIHSLDLSKLKYQSPSLAKLKTKIHNDKGINRKCVERNPRIYICVPTLIYKTPERWRPSASAVRHHKS